MMNHFPRARRLVLLRRSLLVLAVLTSAAAAAVIGFAGYLIIEGYSGDGSAQSVSALAFPIAFLELLVLGLPAALVCAASRTGYAAAARKSRQPSR